jgi:hypothetical protein
VVNDSPLDEVLSRRAADYGFTPAEIQHIQATYLSGSSEDQDQLLCSLDPQYFIEHFCRIYDPVTLDWIPFDLWPEQADVLRLMHRNQYTIALKARQVGLTWIAIAYALWLMLFRPQANILIFSKRETEAYYLLGVERLGGMYKRLPAHLQAASIVVSSASVLMLSNSSTARAFPATSGDSYTGTFAIIDEGDLVPDLASLLVSVRPTVDAGGKLFLLGRVDKSRPQSPFKQIYRQAKAGKNQYAAIFLPWFAAPYRTDEWYEAIKADALANTGTYDDVWEQYPATDAEALMERTLDKRIPPMQLRQVYEPLNGLSAALLREEKAPALPGLTIYRLPVPKRQYSIGCDPAEGNPNSDDSVAIVLDNITGEEVALLCGKFTPEAFTGYIDTLGNYYNKAALMVERNNHGHAVLLGLRGQSNLLRMRGEDKKEGWLNNARGKVLIYNGLAQAVLDQTIIIHSEKVFSQTASIEGNTLRAPEGLNDDCADALALAQQARSQPIGVLVA